MTTLRYSPGPHEVETYSGVYVDTKRPNPDTIGLSDIAHALANICRFGGHCQRFYSVAEHAVFVSKRLERQGHSKTIQIAGLHHDDAEAYLGDIPRPLKPLLGASYKKLSQQMDTAIAAALKLAEYGVDGTDLLHYPAIKQADNWALFVEARHLLPSEGRHWGGHPDADSWADSQPSRIVTPDYWRGGLTPQAAEELFRERHEELT